MSSARAVLPFLIVLLASAATWALLFALVPPGAQDFPLIDDWAFARGAFQFARGEGIHYLHWASMPLVGQWLWAAPWVWAFGDDPVALRISTIVLSWLGLWGFFDLLRQHGISAPHAALTTAALAFFPLFFLLSGTFMSDVPALSFALAGLALYGRSLKSGRFVTLVGAAAVTLLAVTTRQNTLAVPATAAAFLASNQRLRFNARRWLGVLVPAAVGVAAHVWFKGREDVRPLPAEIPSAQVVLALGLAVAQMAGLAALPLFAADPRLGAPKAFVIALAVLVPLSVYWWRCAAFVVYCGPFPTVDGIITPYGVYNAAQYPGQRPVLLDEMTRVALTGLACLGGAWLVARMVDWAAGWHAVAWAKGQTERGKGQRKEVRQFESLAGLTPPARAEGEAAELLCETGRVGSGMLIVFALLQAPFIVAPVWIYDRYLLFILPAALSLAVPPGPRLRWGWARGLGALAVVAGISIALMHDWLSWNAARWALGERAVAERHIEPFDIDGGLEWNGWHAPDARPEPGPGDGGAGLAIGWTRAYFPNVTGRYALSFSELRGGTVIDREPYSQWLLPGAHWFLLVREE